MSEFVPRDITTDLWQEILQLHWTYLETEDGMSKLEERRKLEACLKEFLCIVPHDKKFFLPETAEVLKDSILCNDDFSAYKTLIGFESISQYANNLFTKPWRKEYRVIKMYSGFYQHEIKSNLIGADKLFVAMGYKQLPNQTLVLEGPICPDQVTNVSRDAMAAYVECQIMKQVFSELTKQQLSCSWVDVFKFREKYVGGVPQSAKSMAFAIQERRFRKEKLQSEGCYNQSVACNSCTIHHQHPHYTHPQPPLHQPHHLGVNNCQQQNAQQYAAAACSLHSQQNLYNIHTNGSVSVNGVGHHAQPQPQPPSTLYQPFANHHPPIPHSKSMEHYSDPNTIASVNLGPHRHSFDQPYDYRSAYFDQASPTQPPQYDCVDGSHQGCSYNAYSAHPYNVSGNRYPLPYVISNQLNNYSGGNPVGMAGCPAHFMQPLPLANCCHKLQQPPPQQQMHTDLNCLQKGLTDQNIYHEYHAKKSGYHDPSNAYGTICDPHPSTGFPNPVNTRSNVCVEQLIDLDERVPRARNGHHENGGYDKQQGHRRTSSAGYLESNEPAYQFGDHSNANVTRPPQQKVTAEVYYDMEHNQKDLFNHNVNKSSAAPDDALAYTETRKPKKSDKYSRNAELLAQYERYIDNNDDSRHSRVSDFDSYDDIELSNVEPANKNHEGVGSFESWDYVFQNLEKQGYKKDLGERGNLLMQGLNLDSLAIGDKRRLRAADSSAVKQRSGAAANSQATSDKPKTLEKSGETKVQAKCDVDNTQIPMKAATNNRLNATLKNSVEQPQVSSASISKTIKPAINNNHTNYNDTSAAVKQQQQQQHNSSKAGAVAQTKAPTEKKSIMKNSRSAMATAEGQQQTVLSTANEWSCKFCTYLNPNTKRICDICCRSRDLALDAGKNAPPTCV